MGLERRRQSTLDAARRRRARGESCRRLRQFAAALDDVSGSVTGAKKGSDDNLRPEFEAPFADYIATVVSNLTVLDKVKFDTVTPMNEPSANWWELGHRQEGTHMSVSQQQRMINLLRPALDRHGVSATLLRPRTMTSAARMNVFRPTIRPR
jgi:hypothetical protein